MSNLLFPVLSVLSDGKFHSGEAMARHFKVSRVAIWHALAGAEKLGVEIFSVRGKGYRLTQPLILIEESKVKNAIGEMANWFHVKVLDVVDSTNDYLKKDIGFVAISSNDIINYPDDSPEKMKDLAKSENFPFPYLYDPTQEVAKNYDAACTPDFSVFNSQLKCIYRGQLDDSRPGNKEPINGKDLRLVLDLTLKNKKLDFIQKPSIGCNIKWK